MNSHRTAVIVLGIGFAVVITLVWLLTDRFVVGITLATIGGALLHIGVRATFKWVASRQRSMLDVPLSANPSASPFDMVKPEAQKRLRHLWRQRAALHQMANESELLRGYRETILHLVDELDPWEAERLSTFKTSQLLRQLDGTRWSFRRFCKAAGR